jgi:hypothetical protein
MATFDLDALREAHRPWAFTTGRRTYVARPVSIEQVIAYEGECIGASVAVRLRALRRLLRLAFPWRPSFLWRGDPVAIIMGASPPVHHQLVRDFFASLRSPAESTAPPTSSTGS